MVHEKMFWARVQKSEGCWLWVGSLDSNRYGKFVNNKYAHRFSWELHNGPLSKGECVLHRCDNPQCVNPLHLFKGSKRDNVNDMVEKHRHVKGSAVDNSRFMEQDVLVIRALFHWSGFSVVDIASEYKCSPSTISLIIKGKTWKHIRVNF